MTTEEKLEAFSQASKTARAQLVNQTLERNASRALDEIDEYIEVRQKAGGDIDADRVAELYTNAANALTAYNAREIEFPDQATIDGILAAE